MVGLAVLAMSLTALAKDGDAPADEYFGPFKYSALSARSKITALGRSYRERWQDNAALVHDAGMIESSFQDWARKYPKDRWLAPTAFHLAQLYQEIQTQDARNRARAMYAYVAKTFPSSKEAHFARLRLQQGFPPLHAETPVAATPNPYGSPAASASPGASAVPSGAPGAVPGATTAPPSAAPAPSAPAASAPAAPASASPAGRPAPVPSGSPKPKT